MTAKKFIKENVITINQIALKQHYDFLPSIKKAMIKYAKSKAKEQREICAKEAEIKKIINPLSCIIEIDKNSIFNASEPDFD